MNVNAGHAAITDVLSVVAGELALAQTKCARLDGALGQLLDTASSEQRGAVMRELHVVDLLNQHLGAVAAFVEQLSIRVPTSAAVEVSEALGLITLGEVAARIGEGVGCAAPTRSAVETDVDLF